MTDIAKLLKDAPKGMKLYSPLFGEVEYMQLGDENKIWVKTSCGIYYFDKYGKPYAFDNAECLLFPSKDCRIWEGWKLPVAPKFKVGDWLVFNNSHNSIYQISEIKDSYYMLTHTHGGSMTLSFLQEELIRPWSIADVKDGDVLASIGKRTCPFIYRKTSYNNQLAYYYAGIDSYGDFCEGCIKRTLYHFGQVSNVVPATKEQRDLLFAKIREANYEWNANKKELKKIIEPKFKVGDWIVDNEGVFKITQYEDEHGYDLTDTTGCVVHFVSPDYVETKFHLWTIQDAKDGDVLAADECYVIFKEIDGLNIKCYCTYHYMGFNPSFHIDTLQNKTAFNPATKEQCDLLFKKMKESGYQWDADKKELHKIKHYDIKNFKPFDKVLIRVGNNSKWTCDFFSYYHNGCFHCVGTDDWSQCIPFDGNEHLLGTTDMCDECYINW